MTDIKRDFLYDFNRGLREICSKNPSILSVFENIDNGNLKLEPSDPQGKDFVSEVGKCIYVIKKIVVDPHKVMERKQEIVPVSKAQNSDHESFKLTMADPSLWSLKDGELVPHSAYTLVSDDVFINYENAFIYQLIRLLIVRLKKIRKSLLATQGAEATAYYETIEQYLSKLHRLSQEQPFAQNSNKVVDMANVYYTDVFKNDKRYNYCYRFLKNVSKNSEDKANISVDFRVLYHNYAMVKIVYGLYKNGFIVKDTVYRISASGKMFVDSIELNKDSISINVVQAGNGINIASNEKKLRVEFSRTAINAANEILTDCDRKVKVINEENKFTNVFVSCLFVDAEISDAVLCVGYQDITNSVNKLIKEF